MAGAEAMAKEKPLEKMTATELRVCGQRDPRYCGRQRYEQARADQRHQKGSWYRRSGQEGKPGCS